MMRHKRFVYLFLAVTAVAGLAAPAWAAQLDISRIFIEYNDSGPDLGFHVLLDGEDWREIEIFNPNGRLIFEVEGGGAFGNLGMTELFFEGAEPNLNDVPLRQLLAMMPEGRYRFVGETVDGERITGSGRLTHAVPAAPEVDAEVDGTDVTISWSSPAAPPRGFPNRKIVIVGYQVIVGSFQVTLPASASEITLPEAFTASLEPGVHDFEVLAIEAGGNQTITEGEFEIP